MNKLIALAVRRWAAGLVLGWVVLGLVGCGWEYPTRTVHPAQRQYSVFVDKQSSQFIDQWAYVSTELQSGEQIMDRLVQLISDGLDELNAYLPESRFFMYSGQRAGVGTGANAVITLSELGEFASEDYRHSRVSMAPMHRGSDSSFRVIGTGQMKMLTVFEVKRYLLIKSIPLEMVQTMVYSMRIQFSDTWIWDQLTMADDSLQAEQMIKALLFHELGHGLGLDHSHDSMDVMHPVITADKDIAAFGAQLAAYFRIEG